MSKFNKIWVLTFETNDHDQHGEYFKCAFAKEPTMQMLAEVLKGTNTLMGDNLPRDVMEAVSLLEHIRAGGGRQKDEYVWYNLNEVELIQ